MAVLPESMEQIDPENPAESLKILDEYIRYMGERIEFGMRNMTKSVNAAGISSTELYILLVAMDNRISAQESTVNGLRGTVTGMQGSVSEVQTALTALTERVKKLEGTEGREMATVRVNQDGKAPAGLKTGDKVVTGGGTYEIKGINADGSYRSSLADKSQTTGNYKGSYDRTVQDTVQSALNGMGQKVRETIRKNNIGKKSGGGSYTPLVQSDVDYDQKYLSADDYQAMKAFKNSYAYWQGVGGEAGQRGMKAAHDGAQALRAAAGYQALEDGSGYVPLAQRYQQEEAPEYEGSQWDDTLDRVANRLIGMNYADWTQGDQYQALADRYGQQGRMSMQDVMGQISSRTGGLASSYAGTVAQQQYNNYMTKLEEAAREMYSSERQDLAQNASLASSLAQQDYGRYQDRLAQFNADRALDYNAWQDWQNRVTDAVVRQEEKERTDYQDILTRALQAAEYGDYRYLNALGIDTSDNQRDWERKMQEQEAAWSRDQDLWNRDYLTGRDAAANAIKWANVGVAQQNAATNRQNAATNQQNAATRRDQLNHTIQKDAASSSNTSFKQQLELAKAAAAMGNYEPLEELMKKMK